MNDEQIRVKYLGLAPVMDERMLRQWAANESDRIPLERRWRRGLRY